DVIRLLTRQLVHVLRDLCRAFHHEGHAGHRAHTARRDESLPCRVYARHGGPAAPLLIADLEDEVLVRTHACNRGHAVRRVGFQVLLDVLPRVELLVLGEIDDVTDMAMQVDDAGHDIFAGEVDDL